MVLNHRLYRGEIYHHRDFPRKHFFRYRLFMFFIDLAHLDSLRIPWVGKNRFNLFSFHTRDYLPGLRRTPAAQEESESLFETIKHYLEEKQIRLENPRFFLLTHLRFLGYVFNPVSFYYCYDGDIPRCGIAEVHNTFGERKIYFLPPDERGGFEAQVYKDFYVSPFSHPHTRFHFHLTPPEREIKVVVDESDESRKYFHSSFSGEAHPLTPLRLLGYAFLFIPVTLKVILAIHWEALRLWFKKIPYFPKHAHEAYQRGFFKKTSKKKMEDDISARRP